MMLIAERDRGYYRVHEPGYWDGASGWGVLRGAAGDLPGFAGKRGARVNAGDGGWG